MKNCAVICAVEKIAWVGDCNNVFNSWAAAAQIFGCQLTVAAPVEYRPPTPLPNTHFVADAAAAADGADLVMTDVCVSMGDTNGEKRRQDFAAYMVDDYGHGGGGERRDFYALPTGASGGGSVLISH